MGPSNAHRSLVPDAAGDRSNCHFLSIATLTTRVSIGSILPSVRRSTPLSIKKRLDYPALLDILHHFPIYLYESNYNSTNIKLLQRNQLFLIKKRGSTGGTDTSRLNSVLIRDHNQHSRLSVLVSTPPVRSNDVSTFDRITEPVPRTSRCSWADLNTMRSCG